jgi:hypothetical protein
LNFAKNPNTKPRNHKKQQKIKEKTTKIFKKLLTKPTQSGTMVT